MVTEHEDANDVTQNTMIKVFRSIQKFEGKSQLYTWLYRIATNEAITFLKKKNRKATIAIDNEEMDIAGGGRYTFNDKQYTEYLDYCESSNYIGKELKLNLDLKNDTLYQSWHPIDTLGNVRTDVTLLEKYVRY